MENNILYWEVNTVCVLVLLLLSVKVKKSMFLQEQRILFFKVVISNALFLFVDAAWVFIDSSPDADFISVNWIINGIYYILSAMLGYYWFRYSESVQNSRLVRERKYSILVMLPVIVLTILTLVSFKTGWLFYIDSANQYHRGPLYVFQQILSYGYPIFTAVKAFVLSFRTDDYTEKTTFRTLAVFVLPTMVAGSMQTAFSGYPILCVGNTLGILYVYLTLQEQLVSRDALTKLNNRNQLYQFLSGKILHIHEDKELYLLIMDVDYFKQINDKYGHVVGDEALKEVAGALMRVCHGHSYFVARYGGDEFILICELGSNEPVEDVCNAIHQEIGSIKAEYELSLSIGYAKYESTMKNQQEYIEAADKELYKVKKNRYYRYEVI